MSHIPAVPPVPPAHAAPKHAPEPPPKTTDPAPPLRPTLEDIIDVDQALLALRTGTD